MNESQWWIYDNPWSHTMDNASLAAAIKRIAETRAQHVQRMHDEGLYKTNSLGIAILDKTAPLWRPSTDVLLCAIAIGPEGKRFIQNALAKAVYHRDHGHPAGYGVYMDLTESADGDFCYGYSTEVDGTIAGASGQREIEDAMEAGHAAVSFNFFVRQGRDAWFNRQTERPHWFCNKDEPGQNYQQMLKREAIMASGASVVLP